MIPDLSAIVSTCNAEKLIESRILNLLQQEQSGVSIEIVVVDSGSEENERSVVQRLQQRHSNIKFVRTERETLYSAWNRAIELSTGRYLTSANTDDRFFDGAISRMIGRLDKNEQVALVYADVYQTSHLDEVLNFDGRHTLRKWKLIERPEYSHKELLLGCLCGAQPVWRRALHSEHGVFNGEFVVAGDYEFWLRIAEHYPFEHIAEPLGLVYKNINGLEWRNRERLLAENLLIRRRFFQSPRQ